MMVAFVTIIFVGKWFEAKGGHLNNTQDVSSHTHDLHPKNNTKITHPVAEL